MVELLFTDNQCRWDNGNYRRSVINACEWARNNLHHDGIPWKNNTGPTDKKWLRQQSLPTEANAEY